MLVPRIWGDISDARTQEQVEHLCALPFAVRVCIMPDNHVGYGMPIGGVLATRGVIIPNAVGVDIGCGMRAWATGIPRERFMPRREEVLGAIQRAIPTGFHKHESAQVAMRSLPGPVAAFIASAEEANRSLGTLGGGNHFIELQADDAGQVWAMLHSGSRNLGKQVCEHYARLARAGDRYGLDPRWELDALDADSPLGREYIEAMRYCLDYALTNRERMMRAVRDIVGACFPGLSLGETLIDVHHNYASLEPFGEGGEPVWVHRKGAVRAAGTVIIPGSMGSHSYICRGLDNPEALGSCSHGAGRTMGRRQALRTLDARSSWRASRSGGDRWQADAHRCRQSVRRAQGAHNQTPSVISDIQGGFLPSIGDCTRIRRGYESRVV